jgi:spermidine synthase
MPPVPKIQVFHESGQRLELRDLGSHIELMIGRVPILTSKSLGTELEFGQLAKRIKTEHPPRVLIGGLGFGRTLGGVLSVVGPDAEVIMVEKLTTVIELVRGQLAHMTPGALADPRVRLVQDDVVQVISRERNLDMILLDVDNGPDWASFRSNSRLYGMMGLQKAYSALRSGGQYVVWSGYQADGFLKDLRRVGFAAEIIPLRERGKVAARAYLGRTK